MGIFERFLSLWVALCMVGGVALGTAFPAVFARLAALEYASVNLVVAVLIWAMVYPMMVGVDFSSLHRVGERPRGLIITLTVNWLIKPFTMAALGVLFFHHVFAGLIDPADAGQYIAGLILLGAAPCTAMVFVWSQLTKGDPNYTLVQVSLNDVIMVFAFAPIVALLLGVTDIVVPWATLILSTVLYVVIPLVAGAITRSWLVGRAGGGAHAGGGAGRIIGGIAGRIGGLGGVLGGLGRGVAGPGGRGDLPVRGRLRFAGRPCRSSRLLACRRRTVRLRGGVAGGRGGGALRAVAVARLAVAVRHQRRLGRALLVASLARRLRGCGRRGGNGRVARPCGVFRGVRGGQRRERRLDGVRAVVRRLGRGRGQRILESGGGAVDARHRHGEARVVAADAPLRRRLLRVLAARILRHALVRLAGEHLAEPGRIGTGALAAALAALGGDA